MMVNVQDVSSEWVLVSGPQARCKDIFNQPVLKMLWLFFFFIVCLEKERGNEETVGQWEEARVPWQMSPLFQRDMEWQPQGVQGGADELW